MAGHILGPVLTYVIVERNEETGAAGYLSCCINTPEAEADEIGVIWFPDFRARRSRPEIVWVNAWCSDNAQGYPVGMSYCELIFLPEEDVIELPGQDEGVADLPNLVQGMAISAEAVEQPAYGGSQPAFLPLASRRVPLGTLRGPTRSRQSWCKRVRRRK